MTHKPPMGSYVFANARPAIPFFFDGGAERTTFSLLSGLARKGVPVIQICTLPRGDVQLATHNAAVMRIPVLRGIGEVDYGAFRIVSRKEHLVVHGDLFSIVAVHPDEFEITCRGIVTEKKPELLVTWLQGSGDAVRLGSELSIPTVLRIVGPLSLEGYPPVSHNTVILANSPVTAQIASEYYHRQVDFLVGVIDHDAYVAEAATARFITYVNPRTEKGIHLFCKIAALLPDLPLLAVQGWSQTNFQRDEIQALEFLASLPNVTFSKPVPDMREIYRVTRILVLPSRWLESWSRVIGEAQANCIPVIASSRGCSPESVGEGGIILDYGDPGLWASIIRMVYEDQALWSRLSENAKLNVRRFDADVLLEEYLRFFSDTAAGRSSGLRRSNGLVRNLCAYRDSQARPSLQTTEAKTGRALDLSEPAYP